MSRKSKSLASASLLASSPEGRTKLRLNDGLEYGIFDIGDELELTVEKKSRSTFTERLYIFRTWPKEDEAKWNREALLKYFPPENKWHKRLVIKKHKQILPGTSVRLGMEQEADNDQEKRSAKEFDIALGG